MIDEKTLVLQKIMTYLFDLPHGPKVTQMIKALYTFDLNYTLRVCSD